jgi:hypothetical protein
MPMSAKAMEGLAGAVRLNSTGAVLLLNILRTAPAAVRYKPDDRYGPLGLMLSPSTRRHLERGAADEGTRRLLEACAAFRQEWLDREFSKAELAAVLELLLERNGVSVPAPGGAWTIIRWPSAETGRGESDAS